MKQQLHEPVVRKFLTRIFLSQLFLIALITNNEVQAGGRIINISSATANTIIGTVTDEKALPLPGVNILIKGTTLGTTTDSNGKFAIDVTDKDQTLIFSFIGYVTQEVAILGQSSISVRLVTDVTQLGEVIVVGYGSQKRSSVTGAVSSVTSKEVSALPVVSVESALQGRMAGINVTSNGAPGSTPTVRIRGIGSITGNSQPLYVIDGFPAAGNINNFDTKDIENVEVLKDAAATSIYGSRAANGVILITTKTGSKDNKLHVDIDSYYGVQTAWRKLDLLKRDEYIQYGTDLLNNANAALPSRFTSLNTPIFAGSTQTYAQTDTDWQNEMFRTAPISQTQIALSSSSAQSKMYTSFSKLKQQGIMLGTDFERYSGRINFETNINKWVKFGENLSIAYNSTRNENYSGDRTPIQHIIHSVPYIPVHDPTLLGGYRAPNGSDGTDPVNPVRNAVMDQNITNTFSILGGAFVEAKLLNGLKYRLSGGVNYSIGRNTGDYPMYNDSFVARTSHFLDDNRTTGYSPYISNQLTYDKTFGGHSINIIAVAERQDANYTNLSVGGTQDSDDISQLTGSTNQNISDGSLNKTSLLSYLSRINYEYKGKYLISASIRRDGFSGFAPGNKWGNFPGGSIGWRINEENFMNSVTAITDLKIRASYGLVGANAVSPYGYQSYVGTKTTYPFNNTNVSGAYYDQLPNSDLGWEKTKMSNFGIDLGMFENKFTFSAEYFVRNVDGILLDVYPTNSLGYSQPSKINIGGMKNWGYEFVAGFTKSTGEITYNISANVGIIRNEVKKLNTPTAVLYSGANNDFGGGQITRTVAGSPIQEFFGYQTDGLFQSQEEIDAANSADGDAATKYQDNAAPGDIRFKDINNDHVIDAKDQVSLGSYLPKASYGFNFSANYKSFDFTIFIQGVQGNKIYNGVKVLGQGMLRLFGAQTDVLNAWRPDNTDTDIPRAVSGDPNQNSRTSNRFVEDGSYARLKNISIGYSIPSSQIENFANGAFKRVRVYVSAQNLLTLTKYTGYDPEIGNKYGSSNSGNLINGIDYGQFPAARTVIGGIQIGF